MLLRATVRTAIWLDELLTGHDGVFDIRVLAFIYMAIYLAVLFPLLRGVLSRVRMYSEGLVLAVFSVLVFGDTTIVVRFASLYTQPWELILMILLTDAVFLIPWKKDGWLPQMSILLGCYLLMSVNVYCALASMVFSMAYWLILRRKTDVIHQAAYLGAALLLKEREAQPVIVTINAYGTRFYHCPRCNRDLYIYPRQLYCSNCGQAVKWDG